MDINNGGIIAFKSDDQRYKALLCTSTNKERSPQNFTFAALTVDQEGLPILTNIQESFFYGIVNQKDEKLKILLLPQAKEIIKKHEDSQKRI